MDTVKKLYRARRTVIQMLGDRGYDVGDYDADISLETYVEHYHLNTIDIHLINPDREIYVKFLTQQKTKPNSVREFISEIQHDTFTMENNRIIIITMSKPNNTILKIKNEYSDIEFFWVNRLIVNITHHQYVPLHEKIPDEMKPEIMKRFNLSNIYQLPLIDKGDPISRYYNFKSGDVCRITRKNKVSGISIVYRLVK